MVMNTTLGKNDLNKSANYTVPPGKESVRHAAEPRTGQTDGRGLTRGDDPRRPARDPVVEPVADPRLTHGTP